VRQHTEGMVGSIIRVLLEIYLPFQLWKNFENPLRIDKVIAMSLMYYFFGDTMYSSCGRVFSCFDTIHERDGQTPHYGIGRAYA